MSKPLKEPTRFYVSVVGSCEDKIPQLAEVAQHDQARIRERAKRDAFWEVLESQGAVCQ